MSNQQLAAFKAMKTDIDVTMDDVVSAFVSQYENNLYDRKKELTGDIKSVENTVKAIDDEVHKKVTNKEFTGKTAPFGLIITVSDGQINWAHERVDFEIKIGEKDSSNYNKVSLRRSKPIPRPLINRRDKANEQLDSLRGQLNEVLMQLKQITRKERQVRGKIAMRKLEDSGYASLMADQELVQLVQLED